MSTNLNSGDEEPSSLVQCRVCGSMIDINNKKEQHVVKCEYCNEATVSKPPRPTNSLDISRQILLKQSNIMSLSLFLSKSILSLPQPIKDPPAGQKYIRCPCNCLLICKSTAQRISCPRQSCHKIIVLYNPTTNNNPSTNDISPVPGMCRVNCGHCGETFLFNSLVNQLARCPHCEKKSSVGRKFARARGLTFVFLAILALLIAVIVTVVTSIHEHPTKGGWIALYSTLYIASIYFTIRSIYFLTMKNSLIIENQS